jgi:periplasmic divalent cation tolerance protein
MSDFAPTSDCVTVTTTVDGAQAAQRLAGTAVEARLAACAQVTGPITSTYWWQGALETATEYRVEFKTRAERADELVAYLKDRHAYEVPEVLVAPIVGGNADYLAWIAAETQA